MTHRLLLSLRLPLAGLFLALASTGCLTVRVPEKIHLTVDLNVKIQQELDGVFRKIDEKSNYLQIESEAQQPQ